MALGLARLSETAIGTYVFAFSVAVQSLRLLAGSVKSVLFPSLQPLVARSRQTSAGGTAVDAADVARERAILLAAVGDDRAGVSVVLPAKWDDAILPCRY